MEFGTNCGFSFQTGSLMRANDGSNDLNMHWYEYGMYGMQQYVVVSTNSDESFQKGNAAEYWHEIEHYKSFKAVKDCTSLVTNIVCSINDLSYCQYVVVKNT